MQLSYEDVVLEEKVSPCRFGSAEPSVVNHLQSDTSTTLYSQGRD
ncbi:hypothetical protein [Enterobacter phage vB_EclM_AS6]